MKKAWGFILVVVVIGVIWYMSTMKATAPAAPGAIEPATETPSATAPSTEALSGKVDLTIKDYKYSPSPIRVKKGTTITWTNQDLAKHTVTVDSGKWESELLAQGASYSRTFDTVGTFAYHCSPHPYMKGVVEVVE